MSSSSLSTQRTVIQKSSTAGGGRSFVKEPPILPSSYQLRFGANRYAAKPRGSSYKRTDGVGSNVTQIAAADGSASASNVLASRAEEKVALGSLNGRFVTYIDKVRGLVARNQLLEIKVKQLERSQAFPGRAGEKYDNELHETQKELEAAVNERTLAELELEACYRDISVATKQLKREEEDRRDAENEVKTLCKDVDEATIVRVELEGTVESLREELDLVRRVNDEDRRILTDQLAAIRGFDVVIDGSPPVDLSESLRDIRAAYNQLGQSDKFEAEDYYKTKVSDLTKQYREESDSKKANKTDLAETKRQLQSRAVELEGLRISNTGLNNQLEDAETRYQAESLNYQNIIAEMEKELTNARSEVKRQLVDYNELLNVKLSLDLEIETYQQLLESEENRITIHNDADSSGATQENVGERDATVGKKKDAQRKNEI